MENRPPLRLLEGGDTGSAQYVRDEGGLALGAGLIEVPEYFVVLQDGKIVGRVTAQFDFGNLPAEYHQNALHWLLENRGEEHLPRQVRVETHEPQRRYSILGRVRTWMGLT